MSWHHWNDGNWIRATITNSGTIQVGEKTFLVEYVCICVCVYIFTRMTIIIYVYCSMGQHGFRIRRDSQF